MTSLAADIGGTYSRLAWMDDDGQPESALQSFANAGFGSLEDVSAQRLALRGTPGRAIDNIVTAVPGPVHDDPATRTNIDWRIHRAALQHRFKATTLTVVVDFQPAALYERLAARHGHVSYESIGGGQGLVDTYRFLNTDQHLQTSPRDIVETTPQGNDLADEAIRLFVAVFAAFAGNMALAFGPTGGIYLCGGMTSHLANWFEPEMVAARFTDKGRMRDNVKRIPLFLASSHNAGLDGAIQILKRNYGAEA